MNSRRSCPRDKTSVYLGFVDLVTEPYTVHESVKKKFLTYYSLYKFLDRVTNHVSSVSFLPSNTNTKRRFSFVSGPFVSLRRVGMFVSTRKTCTDLVTVQTSVVDVIIGLLEDTHRSCMCRPQDTEESWYTRHCGSRRTKVCTWCWSLTSSGSKFLCRAQFQWSLEGPRLSYEPFLGRHIWSPTFSSRL